MINFNLINFKILSTLLIIMYYLKYNSKVLRFYKWVNPSPNDLAASSDNWFKL